jgi:hypothetical protein
MPVILPFPFELGAQGLPPNQLENIPASPSPYFYLERGRGQSTMTARLSSENADSTIKYWVFRKDTANANNLIPLNGADLQFGVPQDVLGYTTIDSAGQFATINRTVPLAHPIFTDWYATSIEGITGYGNSAGMQPPNNINNQVFPPLPPGLSIQPANPIIEVGTQTFPAYYGYPWYEFVVKFTPSPYNRFANNTQYVQTLPITYYTAGSIASGTTTVENVGTEWTRYVDFSLEDVTIFYDIEGSNFVFNTNGAVVNGVNAQNKQIIGKLTFKLPMQRLKLMWYGVPSNFVTSPRSRLPWYRGRINQFGFLGYPPGSMLYEGYKVSQYSVPNASLNSTYNGFAAQNLTVNQPLGYNGLPGDPFSVAQLTLKPRLVNIELSFLLTNRQIQNPPLTQYIGNVIYGGHNLLPHWQAKQWYFVQVASANINAAPVPLYYSFPVQFLFTNPDFLGPMPATDLVW